MTSSDLPDKNKLVTNTVNKILLPPRESCHSDCTIERPRATYRWLLAACQTISHQRRKSFRALTFPAVPLADSDGHRFENDRQLRCYNSAFELRWWPSVSCCCLMLKTLAAEYGCRITPSPPYQKPPTSVHHLKSHRTEVPFSIRPGADSTPLFPSTGQCPQGNLNLQFMPDAVLSRKLSLILLI